MIRSRLVLLLSAVTLFYSVSVVSAQTPPETPASATVSKSVGAIGYVVSGGSIKVDLKPTDIMPQAGGQAKVDAKTGATNLEVNVTGLPLPKKLGAEFLTFVLWSVSPDGRTSNLGEIQPNNNGEGSLKVTTQSQTFSLIVTAEPYYSVRQPVKWLSL